MSSAIGFCPLISVPSGSTRLTPQPDNQHDGYWARGLLVSVRKWRMTMHACAGSAQFQHSHTNVRVATAVAGLTRLTAGTAEEIGLS